MRIGFLGAAREVTGSCYLIEAAERRFLVDCGMFQGGRDAAARNRSPRPFVARDIDFVLLTHAHLDHSGWLPRLVADGFRGPIYTTTATADLLAVLLPDSAHLQEMDFERAKRHEHNHNRYNPNGGPEAPLYTLDDVQACLRLVHSVDYDQDVRPATGVRFRLRDAGHILGSAIIELWLEASGTHRKLVFSGDLGQPGRPILRNPTLIEEADVLLVESTYGNRRHKDLAATLAELEQSVSHTIRDKRGVVVVPAFAVGRTQELLYFFNLLTREHRLPPLDVYVDSPMATEVTQITLRHFDLFDEEARRLAALPPDGRPLRLHFVGSVQESMALNGIQNDAVIVSASGMCDGGRIKHHLQHRLSRPENTVLITGFQAEGTLGRHLVEGARSVHIFGEEIVVRAEIVTLGGLSAHADQPALLNWLRGFKRAPARTFVTHGEQSQALAFADKIASELDWRPQVPTLGDFENL